MSIQLLRVLSLLPVTLQRVDALWTYTLSRSDTLAYFHSSHYIHNEQFNDSSERNWTRFTRSTHLQNLPKSPIRNAFNPGKISCSHITGIAIMKLRKKEMRVMYQNWLSGEISWIFTLGRVNGSPSNRAFLKSPTRKLPQKSAKTILHLSTCIFM